MPVWSLAGLRVVRTVADAGSFTAAADSLGYTQSAISRQVIAMEAAAGTALFTREARGVRPTAAGAVMVRHATAVLASLESAEQELAVLQDELAGRLSVGAFPAASPVLVPRALARLLREHSGITVELEEGSTPALLTRLRAGRLGLAVIGVGPGLPAYELDGLQQDLVLEEDLRVAVPAGHRLAHQGHVHVDALQGEVWIVGKGQRGDPQFRAWPTMLEPRIGHAVRGWPARLGLVAAGLGISLLPGLAAHSVPEGVRVLTVEDQGRTGRATVAVTSGEPSRAAAEMVKALRQEAAELRPVTAEK